MSDVTGLLGLAFRAGKLAAGSDLVAEMVGAGKTRVLFLSADAGAAVKRDGAFLAQKARVPLMTLPCDKMALGRALGRPSCAICALSDIGFAASAAKKLAALSEENSAACALLTQKETRIRSRKGIKKDRSGQPKND